MKNTYKILSICLVLFIAQGCQEYLDEEPITQFNEEQVFSTESGVESAVNGLYASFASGAYHGSAMHGLIMPHSGKFWSSQGASEDATSLNCSTSNTWLVRLWPQMYQAINQANIIIANLENSEEDFSNKDFAIAQAYFIRAATYFDLVRLFGGVPLKTVPSSVETLHTPRASVEEVYNLIIADFEKAEEMLPDFGEYLMERPTKYAANAYLAKVYMTMASKPGADQSLWQMAYDEAIKVYGKYALTPTFEGLFEVGNENTEESIFEIQYGPNGGIRNADVIRFYIPKESVLVPEEQVVFGRVRPNKETFDQHVNQYPDDPRIASTFLFDSYEMYEDTDGDGENEVVTQNIYPVKTNGNDGYTALYKYRDPNYNGTTTSANFIKLRYADVLLMLAEIENELNGPTNAYTYVNEVLTRARQLPDGNEASEPSNWSGMSQSEFRERIMEERQYELLGEGHSWFDARRRGYEYFVDHIVVPHNNHPTFDTGKDFVYPITIKNMLLPLPLTELSGNYEISEADQNPGY